MVLAGSASGSLTIFLFAKNEMPGVVEGPSRAVLSPVWEEKVSPGPVRGLAMGVERFSVVS